VQISVHALMRILEQDPEVGDCPSNGLHLYCLTGLHATNRVIACSLICNRNLACGKGIRLDCCDVISVAGELGMVIITLDRLFSMLSCRLAPTDVALVQYGRHAGSGTIGALARSRPSSGMGSKATWVRLLVGFWCENTCHVTSLDPRSGQDRTCPWNLMCGLPLTPLLAELVADWSADPSPYPTPCPERTRTKLLRLGIEGTLVPGYRQRRWSMEPQARNNLCSKSTTMSGSTTTPPIGQGRGSAPGTVGMEKWVPQLLIE
jgi:hypothetical protein